MKGKAQAAAGKTKVISTGTIKGAPKGGPAKSAGKNSVKAAPRQ